MASILPRAYRGLILIKKQTLNNLRTYPFTQAEYGLDLLFLKPQKNIALHYSSSWFTKAINCTNKGEGMGREAGMTDESCLR